MPNSITRFFYIILFITSGVACAKTDAGTALPLPSNNGSTHLVNYLALGDSYTIGQGVTASQRFPAQTVALLNNELTVNNPVYIAATGWTTSDLLNAITHASPATSYDVVSLLIGVNDQYQHKDTSAYAINFEELLKKAIVFASGRKERVFVLSIPDYSVTPFVAPPYKQEVSADIDRFNQVNRRITLRYGVVYIDVTTSSRQGNNDPELVASDGLHPSGKEYKKWAELLAPAIKSVLK